MTCDTGHLLLLEEDTVPPIWCLLTTPNRYVILLVMIKEPRPLTIKRDWSRPAKEAIERFSQIPTSYVVDAMHGRGAMNYQIHPLVADDESLTNFVGPALTCNCGPGDNLALIAAIGTAQPGDVVICATDRFEGSCVTGDLLLAMAKRKGVVGFITDGLIRDVKNVLEVGLPVFCRGTTPNSPVRNGPGIVGLNVTVGDVAIASGDMITADRDGVVVVPQQKLPETLQQLKQVKADEAAAEASLRTDGGVAMQIRELLDSVQSHYVD